MALPRRRGPRAVRSSVTTRSNSSSLKRRISASFDFRWGRSGRRSPAISKSRRQITGRRGRHDSRARLPAWLSEARSPTRRTSGSPCRSTARTPDSCGCVSKPHTRPRRGGSRNFASADREADSRMVKRHPFLIAFLCYSALAAVITFPLVLHLNTKVPADLGDPLLSTSILWWNAHVMPLTERWWNGFAFFPASGMIAFSDHRLGESLLASPIQWIGFSPVVAYNLTLLATFPLSALAAHWLGFTLTRRHDAAVLCGLAFGFSPYRMAHLEHLELLASFALPAALTTLHLFL